MDFGTIIAIALVVLAIVIAWRLVRRHAKGDAGCGCGCEGCPSSLALINGETVTRPDDACPCCMCATAIDAGERKNTEI